MRPYPNVNNGHWVISSGGGRQPVWSADGRELFYRDFDGAVMAVPVTTAPTFVAGRPVKVIDGGRDTGSGPGGSAQTYDVARDRRFLMVKPTSTVASSLVMVLNWFDQPSRR